VARAGAGLLLVRKPPRKIYDKTRVLGLVKAADWCNEHRHRAVGSEGMVFVLKKAPAGQWGFREAFMKRRAWHATKD